MNPVAVLGKVEMVDTTALFDVESSNIDAVGYDSKRMLLFVRFKYKPLVVWCYSGVPYEIYLAMQDSKSIGKYFHVHIDKKYEHEKIEYKEEEVKR